MFRRDFLRDKILHYNAQYTIEQLNNWKTELAAVIRRLNFLYSLREDQILEAASYDNVDWAMISVKEVGVSLETSSLFCIPV